VNGYSLRANDPFVAHLPNKVVNDNGRYRQERLILRTFVQHLGPTALYLPDLTKKWLPENPGESPSRIIEANVLYRSS